MSSIGNVLTRLSMVNQPTDSDDSRKSNAELSIAPENGAEGLLHRVVDATRGLAGNLSKLAMAATVIAPLVAGEAKAENGKDKVQLAQVPIVLPVLPATLGLFVPGADGKPHLMEENAASEGAIDEREAMVCGADGEKCIPLATWISLDDAQRAAAADQCQGAIADSRNARNEHKRLKADPDATTSEIAEAKGARSAAARVSRDCRSALNKVELTALNDRQSAMIGKLIEGAKKELKK